MPEGADRVRSNRDGAGGGGGGELCLRLLCDMRCLVAITFIFLTIFISIIVVGVTSQKVGSRDVSEDLSLVAVDTDMGTDDAYALMMLLEAERRYYDVVKQVGPKVLAVTCVNGNTYVDNVVVNVLKVLHMTGRLDGTIPVYRGASKSILKTPVIDDYFGKDGMGDVPGVPTPPLYNLNTTHAAVALVDLVNAHPGNITLVAIGPLTNVAMAIRLDEDFLKKLKHLFILGGATEGRGNKVPGAEFNFWMDAEANYVVLKEAEYANGTITLLSWEQIEKMKVTQKWRVEELGALALTSARMAFLNQAENLTYLQSEGEGTWDFADAVSAAVVLYPQMVQREHHHAIIPYTQGEGRGAIAVDYYSTLEGAPTVRLISEILVQRYKDLLLDYFAD